MKKPLRFYLRNGSGAFLYCTPSGDFASTGDTVEGLDGTIRGAEGQILHANSYTEWGKTEFGMARNKDLDGCFRVYSPDTITFSDTEYSTEDGYNAMRVIRYLKNTDKGAETVIKLEVYKLDNASLTYQYYGTFDLDCSRASSDATSTKLNVMQTGLIATLDARKDLQVQIELNAGNSTLVNDQLLTLEGTYTYRTLTDNTTYLIVEFLSNEYGMTVPTFFTGDDGGLDVIIYNPNYNPGYAYQASTWFQKDWLFKNRRNEFVDITLSFTDLNLTFVRTDELFSGASPVQDIQPKIMLTLFALDDMTTQIAEYTLYTYAGVLPAGISGVLTELASATTTFSLPPNAYAVMWIDFRGALPFTSGFPQIGMTANTATDVVFSYIRPTESGTIRGLTPQLFWSNINQNAFHPSISDPVNPSSFWLNSLPADTTEIQNNINLQPANTLISCGDAIRKIYTNAAGETVNPTIKTSFNEARKAFRAVFNTGIGIDKGVSGDDEIGVERLRIERLNYFYDTSILIVDLGENVSDVSFSYYSDKLYSKISAGYKKEDHGALNGRYDVFAPWQWYSPALRTDNELDLTCPYVASPYSITYLATNLGGKTSTDNERDNKTFLLAVGANREVEGQLLYYFDRTMFVMSGIENPDVAGSLFNVPLTPKSNLVRNGNILMIPEYLDFTRFASTEGNQTLTTQSVETSMIITEDEQFAVGFIAYPAVQAYKNILISFTSPTPINFVSLLEEEVTGEDGLRKLKVYGCIQLTYKGNILKVHILKVAESLATEGALYKYEGVLSRDTTFDPYLF